MHPEKFVLHDGGIIGPYFIENIAAFNVTIEWCSLMIDNQWFVLK